MTFCILYLKRADERSFHSSVRVMREREIELVRETLWKTCRMLLNNSLGVDEVDFINEVENLSLKNLQ